MREVLPPRSVKRSGTSRRLGLSASFTAISIRSPVGPCQANAMRRSQVQFPSQECVHMSNYHESPSYNTDGFCLPLASLHSASSNRAIQ